MRWSVCLIGVIALRESVARLVVVQVLFCVIGIQVWLKLSGIVRQAVGVCEVTLTRPPPAPDPFHTYSMGSLSCSYSSYFRCLRIHSLQVLHCILSSCPFSPNFGQNCFVKPSLIKGITCLALHFFQILACIANVERYCLPASLVYFDLLDTHVCQLFWLFLHKEYQTSGSTLKGWFWHLHSELIGWHCFGAVYGGCWTYVQINMPR
jgi:hypothetical protein